MCKICGFKTKKIEINGIIYHKCLNCGFMYKDESHILSSELEFDRYKLHNNNDKDYYLYQKSFFEEIEKYLSGNILDYGCGDNHILSNIINEEGYYCSFYDLYFYDNEDTLLNLYNVIILEEVIEHLKSPITILKKLYSLLNKDGLFIIRTRLLNKNINLNSWWYLRDTTHISFFSFKSFQICCELLRMNIIYCNDKDLIILKKV